MNPPTRSKSKFDIIIPTLNRGGVLVQTIEYLISLGAAANRIIVVDQTRQHEPKVAQQLSNYTRNNTINYLKLSTPSVVAAMNVGLLNADSDYVLFLDDDIKPFDDLLDQYQAFIDQTSVDLAAGRVVQPWDDPRGIRLAPSENFIFNSLENRSINLFMGGNFLVNRKLAISLGGFDENFKGTAHNFEREFADRLLNAGHTIEYCANAAIHHLKEEEGGIRTYGHFLKTIKPHHAVGAYYYIFRSHLVSNKVRDTLRRLFQRLATKTHLKQPWWIPITFIGDLLGILWALYLWMVGPKLISNSENVENS